MTLDQLREVQVGYQLPATSDRKESKELQGTNSGIPTGLFRAQAAPKDLDGSPHHILGWDLG